MRIELPAAAWAAPQGAPDDAITLTLPFVAAPEDLSPPMDPGEPLLPAVRLAAPPQEPFTLTLTF